LTVLPVLFVDPGCPIAGMRLLFIAKRFYTNHDLIRERFGRLYNLPVELARRGHDVRVAVLDYGGSQDETVHHQGVLFSSIGMRGLGVLKVLPKLSVITTESSPDVVVASADTPLGWLGKKIARRSRCGFVFDVYDNYASFTSGRLPGVKQLFHRLLGEADLVSVVSIPLADLARTAGANVVRIVNGVDRRLFFPRDRVDARRALGLPYDQKIVGYVGSIEPDRGIESMVAAVRRIRDSGVDVRLVAAGVDKLGVGRHFADIDYLGVMSQREVAVVINACDVAILPYLNSEWGKYTYPNKLAEYIACGTAIVASDVSEFASVLAEAPRSLYEAGSVDSMATAIERQLENPQVVPHHLAPSWAELAEEFESSIAALARTNRDR
jgi:glycosyltransferase involved in cell wall biosynthesis